MTGIVALTLVAFVQAAPPQPAQAQAALGNVTISQAVMADGKPLAAGTYQLRISNEMPAPVVGQSPDAARWVEFLRGGQVAGRELAVVVSAADLPAIVDGGDAKAPRVRVQELKGGDYVRVWLANAGNHYLVHLAVAR